MARRPVEVQEVIDRGSLWKDFKKTAWHSDLSLYLKSRIADTKDSVVNFTLEGEPAKAHAEASRVSGLQEVLDFIEGQIQNGDSIIAFEKDKKSYNEEIPSHVSRPKE